MGKKKIAKKTGEEILKESESVSTAVSEKASQSVKHKVENGCIYIQASYNNTIITVTDEKGNVITWISAGSLGFSGPKKATPFAASRVAEAIAEKIKRSGPFNVRIFIRGIGRGRDSAVKSLIAKDFNILSVKDVTPIPHNGPKPPKVRRV
ncbi:MAG: 30S ribosomal protein S11 [Patescibacteria group bacterium]|nr:30S ribosomal protein S11 [Patescibacteria group bacterium]